MARLVLVRLLGDHDELVGEVSEGFEWDGHEKLIVENSLKTRRPSTEPKTKSCDKIHVEKTEETSTKSVCEENALST